MLYSSLKNNFGMSILTDYLTYKTMAYKLDIKMYKVQLEGNFIYLYLNTWHYYIVYPIDTNLHEVFGYNSQLCLF